MVTMPRPVSPVHSKTGSPAGKNAVMIVDDQSTGRVILAEIVRNIDQFADVVTFERPQAVLDFAGMREQSDRRDPELAEGLLWSRAEVLAVAERFRDSDAAPAAATPWGSSL